MVFDADILKVLGELGPLGVLSLFIVVGGYLVTQGMRLLRERLLPLLQNHLEHLEVSYDKLAISLDKHADAIDGMQQVQSAQATALETHNELTRELIARLPKNHRVKRLLD